MEILEVERRKVTNIDKYFIELDGYIRIDRWEFGHNIDDLRIGTEVLEITYQKDDGTLEVEFIPQV